MFLAELCRRHARERPDAIALDDGRESVTFAELDARSDQFAAALQGSGVRAGARVGFLAKNSCEFFVALSGTLRAGAIFCPINWRLMPDELAFILQDAEPEVLIVSADLWPAASVAVNGVTDLKSVYVIGSGNAGTPTHNYAEWLANSVDRPAAVVGSADDTIMLMYSSGTTGKPKGVMISDANLRFGIEANRVLSMSSTSVSLLALPTFHIAGVSWGLTALAAGARTLLRQSVDPSDVVKSIVDDRVTHLLLVPAVIESVLDLPGLAGMDLSSLELLLYGASPISERTLDRTVQSLSCDLVQGYGATEVPGLVTLLSPGDHLDRSQRHRLRSAGRPVPGVEVRILDLETDVDAETGAVGEIAVRGPAVCSGYWRLPRATAEVIRPGGWLRTGDAGRLDGDGYLYIEDRIKDMIISGGENIYPAEVESVLLTHESVAEAAVVGIPDDRWGEVPFAIVVPASDEGIDESVLIKYVRDRIAHYKCPAGVDVVAALPRNPQGKVLKRELRAALTAH